MIPTGALMIRAGALMQSVCATAIVLVGAISSASAQRTIAPASNTPTPGPMPTILQNYTPVTSERLKKPEDGNWLLFRRTYDGWGYSPLSQITAANVSGLQPVWSLTTSQVEGHQAPPIVNNGVMFVATPGNQVLAIEAKTGNLLWRYKRPIPEDMLQLHPTSRGVGLLGDKVFFAATEAVLVALDAKTGKEVWATKVEDYKKGYYLSLMPLVADGKVQIGTSGGELGVRRRLLYETDKQRNAGWRFIEHRVDITEFMVRLELACRGRQDVELLTRKDILADAPKTQRDRRVRLSTKVRIDGHPKEQSVDPDELFGLRFAQVGRDNYFMFERDRGEMPVTRYKSKEQTYYAKKMLIYHEANRQGVHNRELGIPHFRVATVTTTADRVEQMITAQREITNGKGSNMFLFTDEATFAAGNPLDIEWMSGKGACVRLID